MAMIDTSIYSQGPTAAQGLASLARGVGSYSDKMRQNKIDAINFQKMQMDIADRKRKQEERDSFLADYQTLEMENALTPENLTSLYSRYYPEQAAQAQFRQSIQDPYAAEKLNIRKRELAAREKQIGISRDAEDRKQKYAPMDFKLKQSNINSLIRNRDFNQASKIEDQRIAQLRHNQEIEDRIWERNYKTNKTANEYARKQEQLLGEIPEIVRKNYIGGSEVGGKNLTPENVKTITAGTEGASKILDNTDQLIGLVDKYGLEQLPSSQREKMKTLIGNIALQYKSKEFANLGVLTGPDLEILLSVTGNPTSFTALSADIQKQKLMQFRDGLVHGYNKALYTRGFNPIDAEELSEMGTTKSRLKNYGNPNKLTKEEESNL